MIVVCLPFELFSGPQLGSRLAQDAGAAVTDRISGYIVPLIDGAINEVGRMFQGLFR
jgi:hypothetical protein